MALHRVTRDQAFDLMREHSQHRNIKLRDLALYVNDTGTLPPTPLVQRTASH